MIKQVIIKNGVDDGTPCTPVIIKDGSDGTPCTPVTIIGGGGDTVYNDGYFALPYTENFIFEVNNAMSSLANLYRGSYHLKNVSMPYQVSQLSGSIFAESSIETFYAPELTRTGTSSFYNCIKLTAVDMPKLTALNGSSFQNCSKLVDVNIPLCTDVTSTAFQNCTSLETIDLPSATYIRANAFSGCESLKDVNIPLVTTFGNGAFAGCTSLRTINIPSKPITMSNSTFQNCTNLNDIFVSWDEGEVDGAPWGATNATIHYNINFN